MELLKNINESSDSRIEGEVWFELYNLYIRFVTRDSADIDYVRRCANYMNNLSDAIVNSLCKSSIKYCNSFLGRVKEPEKRFKNIRDVLELVYPGTLLVPDPEKDEEPLLHMELNCEWEVEHGMEWIVRGKRVLYVGSFNGLDPWADFSKKQSWNYA
jgi:hypothetical protein